MSLFAITNNLPHPDFYITYDANGFLRKLKLNMHREFVNLKSNSALLSNESLSLLKVFSSQIMLNKTPKTYSEKRKLAVTEL